MLAAAGTVAATPVPAPVVESPAVRQIFGAETPARDGALLVSDIYLPSTPGPHPVVLFRSPYQRNEDITDRASLVKLAHRYAHAGIGFVHQDTRGRGDSGGAHDFFASDGRDGFDTIEWIARQPWSNGQVAMLGGSYRATVQWLAARERPPHLTCLLSQAPGGEWFQTVPYNGGAFQMEWSLSYLNLTSGRLNNGVSASLTDWDKVFAYRPLIDQDLVMGRRLEDRRTFLAHPTHDEFWQRLDISEQDFAAITLPVLHISGWFDSQLPTATSYWNSMQAHSPARASQYLLIGPWVHAETRSGGSEKLGDLARGPGSIVDIDALSLRWFNACFKGTTASFDLPRARVFLTGANVWRDLPAYPDLKAKAQSIYLRAGNRLDWRKPGSEAPDTFAFDPRDTEAAPPPMRFRAAPTRADTLVYTTQPMLKPLAILGAVDIELHAATSARDTDFAAVLYDVDSQGRALPLVFKTAVLRTRYRQGFDRQVLMTPGRPEVLTLKLFDAGHVVLPGHALRIEVSSHAPGTNPNQGSGKDIATDMEWHTADQTIFHDSRHASRIILPVISWP
jgi:uncharacterized protein